MKKSTVTSICAIIVGVLLGHLLSQIIPRKPVEVVIEKHDTIFVYDTIRYGKDELADATKELPPPAEPEYIYLPEYIVRTEVVHDTTYIVLQRQQYFTEMDDLCIWHSGVQSRIDSVDFVSRSYFIKPVPQKKKMNALSVGMEANYTGAFRIPARVQYTRDINDWFAVYAYAEYDLLNKQPGGGAGGKFNIRW